MSDVASPMSMLFWPLRIFLLLLFVVTSYFIIASVVVDDVKADQVEMELFIEHIMRSPIIMYEDPMTGRVYPGVVDEEKFRGVDLHRFITTDRRDIAARIRLYEGAFLEEKIPKAELFYVPGRGEDYYDVFLTVSAFDSQVQKLIPFPLSKPVTIRNETHTYGGSLVFSVLMQK